MKDENQVEVVVEDTKLEDKEENKQPEDASLEADTNVEEKGED